MQQLLLDDLHRAEQAAAQSITDNPLFPLQRRTVKLTKNLPSKDNALREAHAELDKLEASRAKLSERLIGAIERTEAAVEARRRALIERDPLPDEMVVLDAACRETADAQAVVEEAARHLAEQIEEARRTRDRLEEQATVEAVIAECAARASAIDAAAERLADAARIFADARIELQNAIAQHGVAEHHALSAYGESLPASVAIRPILRAAVRIAAPDVLPAADTFGVAHEADPLIAARRTQSGRLRDWIDDIRAGVVVAESPARPGQQQRPVRVVVEDAGVILKSGIRHSGPDGQPVLLQAGPCSIPRPVAEAAVAAGLGVWPGTAEAVKFMQALQAKEQASASGFKRGSLQVAGVAMPIFADLNFDMGAWLAGERAKMQGVAA